MNIFSTFHRKFISAFGRMANSDVLWNEIMPYILTLIIAGVLIKIAMLILKLM
ncbi:hypothetical protein [Aggregatibacter actinomycetemcomitans]|uniref:hypothetical protein n=1 Tax=Aggregatibacter actinomycetemcomitans TaxID=714 RepID=UPI00197B260F|nr:hypothetical protein [Aggregatibacter actinomycetemcomitans]MBN6058652.1 hypothetical protein [Aggregatibacter actinomycetemcomitans]MBN6087161.1 hypothetical protein [Aggregatibacter actinomycetemcomitans]